MTSVTLSISAQDGQTIFNYVLEAERRGTLEVILASISPGAKRFTVALKGEAFAVQGFQRSLREVFPSAVIEVSNEPAASAW